jgi:hypothetical protein
MPIRHQKLHEHVARLILPCPDCWPLLGPTSRRLLHRDAGVAMRALRVETMLRLLNKAAGQVSGEMAERIHRMLEWGETAHSEDYAQADMIFWLRHPDLKAKAKERGKTKPKGEL